MSKPGRWLRTLVGFVDDPFAGDWQVEPEAFERVRRIMEAA